MFYTEKAHIKYKQSIDNNIYYKVQYKVAFLQDILYERNNSPVIVEDLI